MTTGKAPILRRPGELKSWDRAAAPTTPLVTCEVSITVVKGITRLGLGRPIGRHKSNCGDSVMVLDARRSHKSAASTASLSQTMRPRSGQGRRTAIRSAIQLMRVYFARAQTSHIPRLWRPMVYDA